MSHPLAALNNLAMMYKYLFESLHSVLLGIYPGVVFLDHMVILYSVFPSVMKNNFVAFKALNIVTGTG